MKRGTCPKCRQETLLTKHHVQPKTHNRGRGSSHIEYICRSCHDDLEYFIQSVEGKNNKGRRNKLPDYVYRNLYNFFVKEV